MQLEIKTSITFDNLLKSKHRVIHNIGGTRAGKSYAILQYLIVKAIENTENITIVRKTIPSLKRTVMKDFIDILKSLNIWSETDFNITDRIWTYKDSIIQFISTDDAEKLRGVKSSILFIDEASEIDEESYFQLSIRTEKQIILAYNPTISPYHYLRKMEDCDRYLTTYKDNPYLSQELIDGIEELQHKNPKYWLIYGQGQYAPNERAIYSFDIVDDLPEEAQLVGYGMDWGWNDPTTLAAVWRLEDNLYLQELLYESKLSSSDIIRRLTQLSIGRSEIWGDSADARLIEEIYRGGFNIKPVKKSAISFGIGVLQNYKLHVLAKSQNLINEIYSFQWKQDKYGYATDEPEEGGDHLLDAVRYVALMKLTKNAANKGKYTISII
jgi:phage terminase large subunit